MPESFSESEEVIIFSFNLITSLLPSVESPSTTMNSKSRKVWPDTLFMVSDKPCLLLRFMVMTDNIIQKICFINSFDHQLRCYFIDVITRSFQLQFFYFFC